MCFKWKYFYKLYFPTPHEEKNSIFSMYLQNVAKFCVCRIAKCSYHMNSHMCTCIFILMALLCLKLKCTLSHIFHKHDNSWYLTCLMKKWICEPD